MSAPLERTGPHSCPHWGKHTAYHPAHITHLSTRPASQPDRLLQSDTNTRQSASPSNTKILTKHVVVMLRPHRTLHYSGTFPFCPVIFYFLTQFQCTLQNLSYFLLQRYFFRNKKNSPRCTWCTTWTRVTREFTPWLRWIREEIQHLVLILPG